MLQNIAPHKQNHAKKKKQSTPNNNKGRFHFASGCQLILLTPTPYSTTPTPNILLIL